MEINREQIYQREDEHPDEVNEVPVEAAHFNVICCELSYARRDHAQVADAREDVKHMKPGDAEEGRPEQRRGSGPALGPLCRKLARSKPLAQKMVPFHKVQHDEGCAEKHRGENPTS